MYLLNFITVAVADNGLSERAIAGIVVGVTVPFIVFVSIVSIFFVYRRRRKGRFIPRQISMKKVSTAYNSVLLPYMRKVLRKESFTFL